MSVKLKLDRTSEKNLLRNMDVIKKEYPNHAWQMIVKMLYDMRFLAQTKLKADDHIVTSRLRNSLAVKTPNKNDNTPNRYRDDEGNSFDGDLKSVKPEENEGYFGTNVVYGAVIEFLHDSYIYWAAKHVNVRKRVTDLKQELRKIRFVK